MPGPVVWTVEHSRALPAVQAYALFIIVCQGLLLDPELAVGIKQAAYRGLGLRDPLSYATTQMQVRG